MQLHGQVFLVAGGAGALAAVVGAVFVGEGAALVLLDRPGSGVLARAEALRGQGAQALGLELDLGDPAACEDAVDQALAWRGRLDGLLHLAGAFDMGPLRGLDPAVYDRLFDANVRSLVMPLRAALPHLGRQALVAAVMGAPAWTGPSPGMALYGAAKVAAAHVLRSLRGEEGAPRTSLIHAVGAIDTPGNRAAMPGVDPAGWIDPEQIAQALVFMATRSERGGVTELPIYPPRG